MNDNKCYFLEEINFKECLFPYIDATYVINLIGNGRIEKAKKQIYEYKITYKNYILYNKGYKKCLKELTEQLPRFDLIDAFYKIFEHAKTKNYEYILILEDDFTMIEKIKNIKIRNEITYFLQNNKNIVDIYSFGLIPIISFPYYQNTYYVLNSFATHSMIYSKKFINKTLKKNKLTINDWDFYRATNGKNFMFKEPLCYQLFTETENAKNWGSIMDIKYYDICQPFIKITKIDKKIDGYYIFYNLSKLFGILLFIGILIILFIIIIYIYNYLINKKKI